MDFSKYNKGLRFYATLYNINADVFNTESFINIFAKDKELKIYYSKLYDNYIVKLLIENNYYYNTIIEQYNNIPCVCYIFKFNNSNSLDNTIINCLNEGSNYLLHDTFYIRTCIHWKKYLDTTFLSLSNEDYNS